jgi:SIT4-associating protein SAP185/190
VPSRARRQLAARLALHKQQVAEGVNQGDNSSSDSEINSTGSGHDGDDHWQSNPFVIAGLEDESTSSPAFPSAEFSSIGRDNTLSSPTFPHTGFTPPGSPSTTSSEDAPDDATEAVRRKVRVPLEVDDDDDEMGEMVGPGTRSDMIDSDEEEEAIINESLGYSSFFGPGRYGGFGRSYAKDASGHSMFDDDADDNDSSDGEDDGLVEILVPGRKSSTST